MSAEVTRRTAAIGLAATWLAGCTTIGSGSRRASFDAAFDYSAESGGDAIVVMRSGRVVYERYGPVRNPRQPSPVASATKSFWGPAAAKMISDGLISGWDEPAVATLSEWGGDERRAQITVRHLLTLSSGLENDIEALQGSGTASDKFAHAITAGSIDPPGQRFRYGPVNFYVLGEIMRRKLRGRYSDPLAYLDERLLRPLGIMDYQWLRDPSGNPHMPNGAALVPRQWLSLGEMMRRGGVWRGRRLLPETLVRDILTPSSANPGYGLAWWLNTPGGRDVQGRSAGPGVAGGGLLPAGRPDIAAAIGAGRNALYLIPYLDLVAVRQRPYVERAADVSFAEHARRMRQAEGGFSDSRFLQLLIEAAQG